MSINSKKTVNNNTYNVTNTYSTTDSPLAVRTFIPSGVQTLTDITYGSTGLLNAFIVNAFSANVNGFINAVAQSTITLSAPPTSGTRDDLVFLECYNGTTTRIRVVDNVDFTTYPEGINNGSLVKAMQPGGTLTGYVYTKSATDSGLYVTGTGSAGDKTALGTVDGFVYAIPLYRVKRRNSAGYSVANIKGARNYQSIVFPSSPTVSYKALAQKIISPSDYALVQVGDLYPNTAGVLTNYVLKVISKDGSNTVTVQNISGNSQDIGSLTGLLYSDHPQSYYSNIISAEDLKGGDLRHQVSLTGFNYTQYMGSTIYKIISGILDTKSGKVLQKDWFGIKGYTGTANKNMIPAFDSGEWTLHANAVVNSAYNLTLNATGANQSSSININVQKNTPYYISFSSTGSARAYFIYYDSAMTNLGSSSNIYSSGAITTPTTCTIMTIILQSYASGTITFTNPQLELGSVATAFEPNTKLRIEPLRRTRSDQQTSETIVKTVSPIVQTELKPSTLLHKGYYNIGTVPLTPATIGSATELATADYTNVQTKDGTTFYQTSATAGNYVFRYHSFDATSFNTTVAGIAPSLSKLKFGWDGRVEGDNAGAIDRTASIYIWNKTNLAWESLQNVVTDAINMTPAELTISATFANYVDANGKIWCLSQPKYPASATNACNLYTDTAGLYVETFAWSAGRKVDITSVDGIISGVIDADTALATIASCVSGNNTTTITLALTVAPTGIAVNDTFMLELMNGTGLVTSRVLTASVISGVNVTFTTNGAINGVTAEWTGARLYETTASTSVPTLSNAGVAGTWSGLGTKLATYTITSAPTTVTDNLAITYSANYPAGQGLPYVPTAIKDVQNAECGIEIKGRTLVNPLGRDGSFEVDSNADGVADNWNYYSSTGSTTQSLSTNSKYGTKAQRMVSNGTSTYSRVYFDKVLSTGNYYLYLCDVYPTVANISGISTDSNGIIYAPNANSWNCCYAKITGDNSSHQFLNKVVNGVATTITTDFDGARLIPLKDGDFGMTALQQYNALGTTITDSEVIGRMYPYVDSVQFKQGVMVTTKSKNLIPAFDSGEWTLNANTVVNSSYGITLNATGVNDNTVIIPVSPNTPYPFSSSYSNSAGGQRVNLQELDVSQAVIKGNTSDKTVGSGTNNLTITTTSTTRYILLHLMSLNAGTFTFTNPQLELGSTATTFEAQVKNTFHIPIKNGDGESVFAMPGGQSVFVQKWVKDVQLTGDLAWTFSLDYTGYKLIYVDGLVVNSILSGGIVIKNNGLPLKNLNNTAVSAADQQDIYITSPNRLYISVSDTDTGWSESMTATTAEIKAYFYGWRMTNPTGTAIWDGVSAKNWIRITTLDNRTTVCPVASYAGFTPYTLAYKLATPVYHVGCIGGDQTKPILSPGSVVSVPQGVCQIEQTTGVQWMENAKQVLSSGYAYLNTIGNGSLLLYRDKAKVVLKLNGVTDAKWITTVGYSAVYGNEWYKLNQTDYDPTAIYQITYEMYDKYNYSIDTFSISNPTVSYAYAYQDTTNSEHNVGYFSFLASLFTSINECKQLQIANGDLNGFAVFYEYTPYQGLAPVASTVLANYNILLVTTGGTGKPATVANNKSITKFLPKPTGVYDYQMLQDDIVPESASGENYRLNQVIARGNNTNLDSIGSSVTNLDGDIGSSLSTAVPHLTATCALVTTSTGEIQLKVSTSYATDTSVIGGTATADYIIPGRPLIK